MYLQDLIYVEDGNPDFVEGGLINWIKRQRVSGILQEIMLYQTTPYNLQEISFIQDYLKNCTVLDEDETYKLSLSIETRSGAIPKSANEKRISLFRRSKTNEDSSGRSSSDLQPNEEEDDEEFEITYSKGYKFYEKDSENNIITKDDETGGEVIVAGTIAKLVERATLTKYLGPFFLKNFLLTYRTFLSTSDLIELLKMRFGIPPPVTPTEEVLQRFRQKLEHPIQLR